MAKKPEFIRYHSIKGSFVGLVVYGRKWDRILMIDSIPVHVARINASERKYYSNLGSLLDGVSLFTKLKERQPFNPSATKMLSLLSNITE